MLLRLAVCGVFFGLTFGGIEAPPAVATPLYMLDANGAMPGNFRIVNQATGLSTPINPDATIGPGSWNGLTDWPGNDEFVYAVNNPRPPSFENPQQSRLARIRIADGASTLFPIFEPAAIGVPEIFSLGIAISPLNPTVAVATGFENRGGFKRLIWKVDLDTGAVLAPAVELEGGLVLHALTFGLDGQTLYATNDDEHLVTVDPDTGAVTVIGDTGLNSPLTGLAFRPEDGTLFALEAGFIDRLVTLDPATGAVKFIVGSLDSAGPEGLAFVRCAADVPGDTNFDCVVDLDDLNNVRNHFGAAGNPVLGDANSDGRVDIDDLNEVRNNFGAMPAVPEPATALLALWASMAVLLGRRQLRRPA